MVLVLLARDKYFTRTVDSPRSECVTKAYAGSRMVKDIEP